jgi:DNA-directed RNA polymerase subunit F
MEKVLMFLSFFLGFLSVGLGVGAIVFANILSKRTDVLIKTEDERAKNLIAETQKMIAKMDERLVKMDERHLETMRYLQQSLDYLGSLIKADGEKTRELINKILEKIPG